MVQVGTHLFPSDSSPLASLQASLSEHQHQLDVLRGQFQLVSREALRLRLKLMALEDCERQCRGPSTISNRTHGDTPKADIELRFVAAHSNAYCVLSTRAARLSKSKHIDRFIHLRMELHKYHVRRLCPHTK